MFLLQHLQDTSTLPSWTAEILVKLCFFFCCNCYCVFIICNSSNNISNFRCRNNCNSSTNSIRSVTWLWGKGLGSVRLSHGVWFKVHISTNLYLCKRSSSYRTFPADPPAPSSPSVTGPPPKGDHWTDFHHHLFACPWTWGQWSHTATPGLASCTRRKLSVKFILAFCLSPLQTKLLRSFSHRPLGVFIFILIAFYSFRLSP